MSSIHVDIESLEWASAVPFYGSGAIYKGKEIIQLKVLCDRRHEGAGISWLVRFEPPSGKLIKIIAMAQSDEHILVLEGSKANKYGQQTKAGRGYGLNPEGQPHSAMVASKMTAFVVYTGEPDDIKSIEVVDLPASA